MFKKIDLLNIYSGVPLIVFALAVGLLSAKLLWNLWATLVVTAAGVAVSLICCIRKFRLSKETGAVSFGRCVVFDGAFASAAFILNWFYIFFPIPFSIERLLGQFGENEGIVPIQIAVLVLFLIPMILTNRKLKKAFENKE